MSFLGSGQFLGTEIRLYDDVDSRLHTIALASLEAHLLKLQEEKIAEFDGTFWSCIN